MKIKKKMLETKDKLKLWWIRNKNAVILVSLSCAGTVLYCIGLKDGRNGGILEGRKRQATDLIKEFGIDPCSSDTTVVIRNCDTGFIDAIVTKEFDKLIFDNCNIIKYDDGSWEFESETKA